MKKALISAAVIALPVFASVAHASDGTINFSGELVAQTCTIDVNGTVTPAAATVTLPTVSTGLLTTAGQTTGQTGFQIGLSNCSGPAKSAAAFFESGATVDPLSGNLKTTTGTGAANNVQLQLVDASNGSVIKAGDGLQHLTTTKIALDASGNAKLPYAVQYFATGATTSGTVNSSVTYSIDYQ
ncbi:fimbrial protein [Ralstonia insidiosa]|uniref:Type 1 fimbrial protein n=1 Tax=Ralstonia insidiosa TaxID=190721 RepID=A0A848P711_9RALS|nr:fimbrial protein [Ralstonia insidiosa]NMV41359.1 type 1 fimbrial protein [Ralstonia insidiosa]